MDIFKQYDTFKEKCNDFPDRFMQKYFSESRLICHPTILNELVSVCSDEEARTNAICICRMADMLLMSEDNIQWSGFNITEARKIAEQNGYVYISDLLAEDAFLAEEWMIDGKHDTVIVNEEYMREKGKKYAPVTPLTNKVLHFKKYNNSFFWKKAKPGEILCIDNEYIDNRFEEYMNECAEKLPDLSALETINIKVFDREISIDANTNRIRKIEMFFDNINEIVKGFSDNEEILNICGYHFSSIDFILRLAVKALNKNGIDITEEVFNNNYYSNVINTADASDRAEALGKSCGDSKIDYIKLAFIDAINEEYGEEIKFFTGDSGLYNTKLRRLELGNYNTDEEKYLITELISCKPDDYRIFYYAATRYPEESENLAALAGFWNVAPQNEEEMENAILGAYIGEENFDDQGRFCAGYEETQILKENLEKVIIKYGLSCKDYIEELSQHIDAMDKQRRTFNGTLFSTPEEKKLAVKNEAYIQDLCVDLSALNESELNSLSEHIENTTLDDNTKSKYKLKVKLALNNVQSSILEQLCLKLPVMTLDEIAKLKSKILADDYPEAVIKPFAAKIKEAYLSAQTEEIENLLENSENFSEKQLDDISLKLESGRYEASITEYYKQKIDEIKDKNIRAEINNLVDGYEDFDKDKLVKLIQALSNDKYPKYISQPLIERVTAVLSSYEQKEAAKAFDGVDFATKQQLEKMKKMISDKLFSDEILEFYEEKLNKREKELLDEELIDMCKDIDSMPQEALDSLKDEIISSDKNFEPQLVDKYLDKIEQRLCELKNSELAELCKYIFSMEQSELDELKEKLSDEKYDKEITDVYYRKISEREYELLVDELEELCVNIDTLTIDELNELKVKIIDNERYTDICDKYIFKINNQIESIKISEYKDLIARVEEMDSEEVEEFRKLAEEKRSEIGEDLYNLSISSADSRENKLEDEALEQLCKGIEEYDFDKAEGVLVQLSQSGYSSEKIALYTKQIENRIFELHTTELDSYVEGIESMNKEQVITVQIKINEYSKNCPVELIEKYNMIVENALAEIADREVRELCGNIESLSAKKSADLIRKLDNMPLDSTAKNKYINALDSHIVSLKAEEAQMYVKFFSEKMSELELNLSHFCVYGMTNLFDAKYASACENYVSIGRYELPILIHEVNSGEGFTLTTEFLFIFSKDETSKIKIDDILSFQAKKTLMSSALTVSERDGNSSELPNILNKNVIENAAKALTALVCYIHDRRSAEHMKDLLDNAVQEKVMQAAIAAESINEGQNEEDGVKVKFCDQCGAKITSSNAKFCAECGNKLI